MSASIRVLVLFALNAQPQLLHNFVLHLLDQSSVPPLSCFAKAVALGSLEVLSLAPAPERDAPEWLGMHME